MGSEVGADVRSTGYHVDDAWGQDLVHQLDEPQGRQGREGGGLDDDSTTDPDRRHDMPDGDE
jgi:hypothetical protein